MRAKPNKIRDGLDIPLGDDPIQINVKTLLLNDVGSQMSLLLFLNLFQILLIINFQLINNISLLNLQLIMHIFELLTKLIYFVIY